MKLKINRRFDSRGFRLNSRLITLSFHFWHICKAIKPQYDYTGWLLRLDVGPGAGYKKGFTAFLGWRARGGKGNLHGPWPKLRIGITKNGNHIPYSFK